jgi:hypothetical protein
MAYEIPGQTRSYEAAVDLSGSYLRFVKLNGAVLVAVAAATDKAVGVLQNKPNKPGTGVFLGAERSSATVMISGVTRAINGVAGALAAGVPVYLDSVGRVTTTAQAGQCVGITETAAAAQGEVVSVLLKPLGSVS